MFESLSDRLSGILDKLTGRGALSEAAHAFASFLECWCEADAHLPELQRARTFLASHGGAGSKAPASANVIGLRPVGNASR